MYIDNRKPYAVIKNRIKEALFNSFSVSNVILRSHGFFSERNITQMYIAYFQSLSLTKYCA